LHPPGIEGANHTIFVRRIALPKSYVGRWTFKGSQLHSVIERFRATVTGDNRGSRVVKEPEDTQRLLAAASWASESADIKEGSDSKDNLDEE
jgi:hypothetical protein